MLSLDPNKAKHINQKSIELVELVETFEKETRSTQTANINNSISNKIATDLSNKILHDRPYHESLCDPITGEKISIIEIFANKRYGFSEQNFPFVKKITDLLLKERSIGSVVSYEFLFIKTLEWVFGVYNRKQILEAFTDFILFEANEAIKRHDIYFPVEMLEISGKYEIGKAMLLFVEKDYLDALEKDYLACESKIDNDYFKVLRESYQGSVFVGTSIKAEREKP